MSRFQAPAVEAAGSPFSCIHCGTLVVDPGEGTEQRNHCPHCLWSRHVDHRTGDRLSLCRSPMEPIAVWAKPSGEWALVHRCAACGAVRTNRIAGDDSEALLLALVLRPLTKPAFPLDRIGRKA